MYNTRVMDQFKGQKVLVFGLGLNQGGVGSAKFFAKNGALVRVTDLKSQEILQPSINELKSYQIEYTLGEHKNEDIEWADLIIKNPAIKPGNQYIEYAKSLGKRVEMDMGIFLEFVKPSQIIGVTGTKGKSTTSSLTYEVLKFTARVDNIIFAGNIGTSVLEVISQINSDTLVVLELSSFQLEAFDIHKVSPHWAVITNIYPDHLNYYSNMEEYIAAKKIIGKYQTAEDYLFINQEDKTINAPAFSNGLKGQIIYYSASDLPINHPMLQGDHNKSNMAAALAVGKVFQIPEKSILEVMQNFKGVPFRMELIKDWNRVKIINDTTATGPDAGIQALKTFPNCILICGGMNKGMDYTEYATIVASNVKRVFFLEGDATEEIKKNLSLVTSKNL